MLAHTDIPEYAKAVPLVKALLNYGTAAQVYFGVGGDAANDTKFMTDEDKVLNVSASDIYAPASVFEGTLEGVTYEGSSLSLKSELTVSLYFKSDKDLTFECDGKTVETVTSRGYRIARIRGIKAFETGNLLTLKVSSEDGTGTLKYSALSYCNDVLNGNYDKAAKDAVKALYLYYIAASEYTN